ncbi:hypothetical protein BH11PLA1_BH11PLA1_15950 [soil metagenome]
MALQSQISRSQAWQSPSSPRNPLRGASPATKLALGAGVLVVAGIAITIITRQGPQPLAQEPMTAGESPLGAMNYPAAGGTSALSTGTDAVPAPTRNAAPLAPTPASTHKISMQNPGAPTMTPPPAAPTPAPAATPGDTGLHDPLAEPGVGKGLPTAATPANPPAPSATPTQPALSSSMTGVGAAVAKAQQQVAAGDTLGARTTLNSELWDKAASASDRSALRQQIAALNDQLFFGALVAKGDPIVDIYAIKSGDVLARLPLRETLPIDYRFLQRINGITNPSGLRIGQRIKVVRMPIHAVVHKKDFRMDLYAGAPATGSAAAKVGPDGQDEGWIFLRSLQVGLGASNGTPEGLFVVRPKSKLINPRWVNPRNGEVFEADNPNNPIGEHWIGLDGVDENTKRFTGYGIHGTVDPSSIGASKSMGCVRLKAEDVALVWELLVDKVSSVKIIE